MDNLSLRIFLYCGMKYYFRNSPINSFDELKQIDLRILSPLADLNLTMCTLYVFTHVGVHEAAWISCDLPLDD